jgi:hypothetical protein
MCVCTARTALDEDAVAVGDVDGEQLGHSECRV